MTEDISVMRSIIIAMALAAVAVAPASAAAADHSDCSRKLERSYSHHYKQVAHKFGKRQPGRNIRRQGMRVWHKRSERFTTRNAKCSELARSDRTFKRWMAPPAPPAMAHDTSSAHAVPAYAGGNYAIPRSIVMCESGGNYNAVNPSSGAYGAYQILPSTSAGLGCDMSTPAGQDACAQKVWATQGRGAWVC